MSTIIQAIASTLQARANCKLHSDEWLDRHTNRLAWIEKNLLPSGSGFDAGTKIALDACTVDKVVLVTEFHHMNDDGYYDGWTTHQIIIKPTFSGFDLRIGGQDRNGIKEYIAETFHQILGGDFPGYPETL